MKKELSEKLLKAGSPEEIVSIAKASGQEITPEQAEELFDQILASKNEEDLSIEDLDFAAGGTSRHYDPRNIPGHRRNS